MSNTINDLEKSKPGEYKLGYEKIMSQVMYLSILASSIVLFLIIYSFISQDKSKYYATTTTGIVVPMNSLSEPVVTDEYVSRWASIAARDAYNLDFVHYKRTMSQVQPYFSREGWESFQEALESSKLLENIVSNKLRAFAINTKSATVTKKYIKNGRLTRTIEMPLLIKYEGSDAQATQNIMVKMDVARVPALDAPEGGIQIVNFRSFVGRGGR